MEAKADILFEASWDVCNKVGGIYTVVTSKVMPIESYYKENYYLVGPYVRGQRYDEFQEQPAFGPIKTVFDKLQERGITCHVGKWLVDGEPNTILVEYADFSRETNEIKKQLWERFGVDSLGTSYYDFDEPVVWSTAVGLMIEEFAKNTDGKRIAAQFHEWMCGAGMLYLRMKDAPVGTIFTTHATMLGRTLAANHVDLYNNLDKINPEQEAYRFNIQAKFHMERACAHNAHVFTTVSEITGIEATYFLGKAPDVLLPNGLDIEKFPTFEDASIRHKFLKEKIKQFCLYYFFPYYSFDLDNTLFFFTAARYEPHDKGIDIFIKALARLNSMLTSKGSEKNIVAFIWVPAFARNVKKDLAESRTFYEDIRETIVDMSEDIRERMTYGLVAKKEITPEFVLGETLVREMKKKVNRLQKTGLPPVCSHDLTNESSNEIMQCIFQSGLSNKKEDKVKIVYYPIYLTGADSLLDLNYYEAILASHLGVFPSYYEPWGYTPLETGALGVAAITTDLAGFGRYIGRSDNGRRNKGLYVLKRQNRKDEEVVEDLCQVMYQYAGNSKQDRIENKLKAKRIASLADWKLLVENYIKAQNLSIDRLKVIVQA